MAFKGMALEFEKAGRAEQAAKWRERADYAEPSRFFGGIGWSFGRASQGSNIAGAGAFAAFLYGLYLVVKVAAVRIRLKRKARAVGEGADKDELKRFFGPVPISRLEIAGFVTALATAFAGVAIGVPGTRAIARAASIEIGATNGSWGSPAAVNYWKEQAGSPEGDEHYALALIQAGKREEAVRILEELAGSAEAQNNLGVALTVLGREEEARAAFERALAVRPDLPEALYNLGREASSVRVDRAKEYLPGRPLLAMPSQRSYERLLARPHEPGWRGWLRPLIVSPTADVGYKDIAGPLGMLLSVLAAVAYGFWRAEQRAPGRDDADWWLSLAIPGSSRRYAPWGVLLLAAYVYFGLIAHANSKVPGALSVIDAIGMPNLTGAFGVGASHMSGGRAALIWTARVLVWLIPIASAAGVLAFRFLGREDEQIEESAHPFWWRIARAVVFLALGVPVLVFSGGVAAWMLPAAILILAGVASAAVAVIDHRREAGASAAPA
jgi:tetratricopeptide (TPR) repeat protein